MRGSPRAATVAACTAAASVLAFVVVPGQTVTEPRPPMAEEVFKNVQVLRGIPVNDFMGTMGIFSAALGMSCEDCHRSGDSSWENYAAESPRKQMARSMVVMMAAINKTHFGGRQGVTCFSCHRGSDRPKLTPDLRTLYGAPPPEDPRDILEQAPTAPAAVDILNKYIAAIGGAQRVAGMTSYAATGTSVGYGPDGERRPIDIVASAPNRRSTIVRTASGDQTTSFDGRNGWIAAPYRPVPVLALAGADLGGLRLDAQLTFPAGIANALGTWRVGQPRTIEDREVHAVQGTGSDGLTATLFFDAESGLLVRQLRYVESPVGRIPTQVDYADYREVSGIRVPFRWVVTWLDGRDTIELTEVRLNVPIDAARYRRPPPPVAPAR